MNSLDFVWLEITGRCQLECLHCYADSGPRGTHGQLTEVDWIRIIDDAAELGARMVQFIGGEPTLHPSLPTLVDHACRRGMAVEVFSNLVHVPTSLWDLFAGREVALATSYYSDAPAENRMITRRNGSLSRTRANIEEALRRSIPIRVGLIQVFDDQRIGEAERDLRRLGVTEFGRDRVRPVGRGGRASVPDGSPLCGHCANGKIAIASNGDVWPCVFARWMTVGNVGQTKLPEILTSAEMYRAELELANIAVEGRCNPKCCPSTMCDPQCSPSCSPSCTPAGNCRPAGNCAPNY